MTCDRTSIKVIALLTPEDGFSAPLLANDGFEVEVDDREPLAAVVGEAVTVGVTTMIVVVGGIIELDELELDAVLPEVEELPLDVDVEAEVELPDKDVVALAELEIPGGI